MPPPDEPRPSPTRRRVRVFVIACLLIVLVVGFWPVRGHEIKDASAFGLSLGEPRVRVTVPLRLVFPPNVPEAPIEVGVSVGNSYGEASDDIERSVGLRLARYGENWNPVSVPGAQAYGFPDEPSKDQSSAGAYGARPAPRLIFRFRNLVIEVSVVPGHPALPPGKDDLEVAAETARLILLRLEAGAPGVRTTYLPPAVQFCKSELRPKRDKFRSWLKRNRPW